ncbi:carboxylesterase family protein [Streptomyces sp. NBC_00193]|uniref:carboxylesterase/lipase family protein n=1 Tax=unclassified Streptomyces TaxID=2593676 RepID=UPI00224C8AE8|nr:MULTISPECIES: carboxylesterase family protein [unclassified Streptomyces]MCX5128339.1 carboxylesterase family protein [Streptomyces sp. NBC_00347]MCX5300780.1 carboxylesterase family protein [Streptomyces sp. NBC_00193]
MASRGALLLALLLLTAAPHAGAAAAVPTAGAGAGAGTRTGARAEAGARAGAGAGATPGAGTRAEAAPGAFPGFGAVGGFGAGALPRARAWAGRSGHGGGRPVVETDRGAVRGREADGYRTFEGIPYAAPPTGPLRWRLPEPAARWTGVRDAGAPGARCVQLPAVGPGAPSGSEDCLFLNVTVPAEPTGTGGVPPRPVMVWFHGGGFMNGAGDPYRPGRPASADGPGAGAVVVTVNYRLGIFGLLGHPALHGAPDFALADQQAALRWVRANAARFGGDPGNVTVFGESAGGLSVCLHLTSPASAGLFHRAIVQSGSCSLTIPPHALLPTLGAYEPFVPESRTVARGTAAAVRLGCGRPTDEAALECLRGLAPEALATPELMMLFSAVSYGTPLLPTEPRRALERGGFHRVPVVQGSTRDEMRLFLGQTLAAYPVADPSAYRSRLRAAFGAGAGLVEAAYPVTAHPTPALAFAAALTDASFVCPQLRDSRALARHVPTYDYAFDDRLAPDFTGLPPVPGFPYGASHGSELPYLFDTGLPMSAAQRVLAERMTGYWTRFAATGDPNTPGTGPWWPRSPAVLSLAPEPAGGIRPVDAAARHHCGLWDSLSPGQNLERAGS